MTISFGLATTTEWRKSTRTHCDFIASNVQMNAAYCTATTKDGTQLSVTVSEPHRGHQTASAQA